MLMSVCLSFYLSVCLFRWRFGDFFKDLDQSRDRNGSVHGSPDLGWSHRPVQEQQPDVGGKTMKWRQRRSISRVVLETGSCWFSGVQRGRQRQVFHRRQPGGPEELDDLHQVCEERAGAEPGGGPDRQQHFLQGRRGPWTHLHPLNLLKMEI